MVLGPPRPKRASKSKAPVALGVSDMLRDFDLAGIARGAGATAAADAPLTAQDALRARAAEALGGVMDGARAAAGRHPEIVGTPPPGSFLWQKYDYGLTGGMPPVAAPPAGLSFDPTEALSKAMTTPPEKGDKAVRERQPPTEAPKDNPDAIYYYFQSLLEQLGWRERYGTLAFDRIDEIWHVMPMCAGIRQTRLNQISNFCSFVQDKFEPGCRIRLRNVLDTPTRADQANMQRLRDMLEQSSAVDVDARLTDGLETFVRKFARDSMSYDQAVIETVNGRDGRPARWLAADGKTFRFANPTKLYPTLDLDAPYAVQIIDQQVVKQFSRRQIAFCIRNPRTDIRAFGYGESEIEMLVSALTSMLFSTQHNDAQFKNGANFSGILNVKGEMPDAQLKVFIAQFHQMLAGPRNAHRLPIMNQEGLDYIDFKRSNRDMEYAAWIDFLIKQICAVFCMDPIEVNFKYASSGGKCYGLNTPILMFDGYCKMSQDVAVGDLLMGPDGAPRTVQALARGRDLMYEIKPSNGEAWRCNSQHVLVLQDARTGEEHEMSVETLVRKGPTFTRFQRLVLAPVLDFAPRAAPVLDPYFYGVWVGDGSKKHEAGVWVSKPDIEIQELMEEQAALWGLTRNPVFKNLDDGERELVGHRLVGEHRVENPLRTELDRVWTDGRVADEFKFGSRQVRLLFLAGVLDSDGSLPKFKSRRTQSLFTFTQVNKATFDDVCFIARSLGFRVSPPKHRTNGKEWWWQCSIGGPIHTIPTRIARKRAKAELGRSIRSGNPLRPGFKLSALGEGDYYGWLNDGDHRHLLGDFTVAHNSMFEGASKSKTSESKDRGLRPLLRFIERTINRHIVWPINPAYSFEFTGLDLLTPKELADLMVQRVRSVYTVNEVRAELDKQPLKYGDFILDANYANFLKQGKAEDAAKEAQRKSEAELEAQAAVLASMPEADLPEDEIARLAAHLTSTDEDAGGTSAAAQPMTAGTVAAGMSPGGPGGGRRGTAPSLPGDPNAKPKPNPATPVAKSARAAAGLLLEIEV